MALDIEDGHIRLGAYTEQTLFSGFLSGPSNYKDQFENFWMFTR